MFHPIHILIVTEVKRRTIMLKNLLRVIVAIYVLAATVIFVNDDKSTVHAAETEKTAIMSSKSNIYKGPGKTYGKTGGSVKKGELIIVTKAKGSWVHIQSNNDMGWVSGKLVDYFTGFGVSTKSVDLYKGPGSNDGKNGKITKGATVLVFSTENGYTHIYTNGKEAWVKSKYIKSYTGYGIIDGATYANLYNGPAKSYGKNGKINKGTTLLYGELKNNWRKVFVNGKEAWVWNEYIKKSSLKTPHEGILTKSNNANLYKSAGKSYGKTGKKIKNGQNVIVLAKVGSWKYLQTNDNKSGWVKGSLIVNPAQSSTVKNVKSYANLYKGPAKKTGTKGKVYKGTAVEIKEKVNNWRHVKIGDTEGWIWAEYVPSRLPQISGALGQKNTMMAVKVYRGPNTDTGTLGTIPANSTISLYDLSNGLRFVDAGFVQGWVQDEYINSFLYLDLRTPSNITAKEINAYIAQGAKAYGKESVIAGQGQAFIDAAKKYGLNAHYLAAHAIHESAYGTSNLSYGKYNLFGLKAFDGAPFDSAYRFKNVKEMIEYEAAYVRFNYIEPTAPYYNGPYLGNKNGGMNVKYASDPLWGQKIANHMEKMKKYDAKYYSKAKPVSSISTTMPPVPNYKDKYPNNIQVKALQNLPLYKTKNNTQTRIGTISKGDEFILYEKYNDFWLKVKYKGQDGWTFFAFSQYKNYMKVYNLMRAETSDNSKVAIYEKASTSSKVVVRVKNNTYLEGVLNKNKQVETDSSKKWYKVKTSDGKTGWIQSAYAKRVFN